MTSSRIAERWTMVTAVVLLISQVLLGRPASAAPATEALLPPTPLVLKDGRIANVSIHILPFVAGDTQLAGDTAGRLASLTSSIATDCFLTAQVIGHVSSEEVTESETLAAHRLARSRADAVQSSLIGGGLPAKAIASVWDWQFLVREPRATLWVFRLIEGEDCDGVPLDGDASQLVAEADATPPAAMSSAPAEAPRAIAAPAPPTVETTAAAPAATPRAMAPAPRTAEVAVPAPARAPERTQAEAAPMAEPFLPPMVSSAVAAEAIKTPEQAQAATQAEPAQWSEAPAMASAERSDAPPPDAGQAEASPRAEPQSAAPRQAVIPAGPAQDEVPVVTKPLPALSPSQDTAGSAATRSSDNTALAAVQPEQPVVGGVPAADASAGQQQSATRGPEPGDPGRQGKVEWAQDGVVITFATNSSYFPPGTSRRLKALVDGMANDARYRVQLQVGVSGSDTVVGATSPEEARRYNRWLAERRLGRVQEWLSENAVDRQIEVEPQYLTDDSSRRVVVRIAPTG
jgi:hypothetical protein